MRKYGIGILGVLLIGMLWFISTSNSLNSIEIEVEEAQGQVENVLQRRYDLIPNLVNAVQGSMNQEKEIFTSIAEARKEYSSATTIEDKNEAIESLSTEVGTLVSVINESYPELASSEAVKDLMTQLEGTENRISVERRNYNSTVAKYNKKIRSFPTSIVASAKGMTTKSQFTATEGAETAPEVSFE